MKFFKFIEKFKLEKENSIFDDKIINISQNIIPDFESGNISQLDIDGILDTEDLMTIAKFRNNLKILSNKALEDGYINNFKLIRDDDFFPIDYMWTVSSYNTNIELGCSLLSYELREAYAERISGNNFNGISIPSKKFDETLKSLDKDFGKFYVSVAFRSTKHFTINTPLGYTHDYNHVKDSRKFTIIDNVDNFINSGYAYTMSYRDSYLDVSHEPLTISKNAIVLISQDNYNELSTNCEFQEQISNLDGRKLIIYKGDESTAINMVLTQLGTLPSKVDHRIFDYDSNLNRIIEQSMIDLCSNCSIEYNVSHGNNHFTSKLDELYNAKYNQGLDFYDFLKSELSSDINFDEKILLESDSSSKFIKEVGIDRLLSLINKFNGLMPSIIKERYNNYINDRNSITPSVSNLFKQTTRLINNYYSYSYMNFDDENKKNLSDLIELFFQCDTVEEQAKYAATICRYLDTDYYNFDYDSDNNLKTM